jgi:hypothetical protein
VKATGIVVRHPVFYPFSTVGGDEGGPAEWVLIADPGTITTPPAVMASLEASWSMPTSVADEIRAADGKLVTIDGTLGARAWLRSWSWLAVGRVEVAPADAQLGLFPEQGLVQPGDWFNETWWRRDQARVLSELENKGGTRYGDPREAQTQVGRPLLLPAASVAGTPAVVYVDTRADKRMREVTLLFDGGLRIVEAGVDTRPVYRWQKLYSRPYRPDRYYWGHIEETTTVQPPDYAFYVERLRDEAKSTPNSDTRFELARISGRPGIWGPDYVQWWDGTSFITIRYGGPPSGAPTRQDLLEIARSMKRVG